MSSLKQLRTRIKSVSSTQKITAAMKMVAAAKLKKAEIQAKNVLPFEQHILEMAQKVIALSEMEKIPLYMKGSDAPPLFILFAADKGLCGGFNSTIFKTFSKNVEPLINNNQPFYCIGVGHRAERFLKNQYGKYIASFLNMNIENLPQGIKKACVEKTIGQVQMVYTRFRTILSLLPVVENIIPIEPINKPLDNMFCFFEPHVDDMIDDIFSTYMQAKLIKAKQQSFAAEQAARMTAMDNSTNNAKEMADHLKLTYNRTRQALITKELIEIISGAKAATS